MNRRSFITSLIAACAAPAFLPGASRIWRVPTIVPLYSSGVMDIIVRESGRMHPYILQQMFKTSPWIGLLNRDKWPNGMGETLTDITYERSSLV